MTLSALLVSAALALPPQGDSLATLTFDLCSPLPAVRARALLTLREDPRTRDLLAAQPIADACLGRSGYSARPQVRSWSHRLDLILPGEDVFEIPSAEHAALSAWRQAEWTVTEHRLVEHWLIAAHQAQAWNPQILALSGHESTHARALVLARLADHARAPAATRQLAIRMDRGGADSWTIALALAQTEPGRERLRERLGSDAAAFVLFGIAAHPGDVAPSLLSELARDFAPTDPQRAGWCVYALARKSSTKPAHWLPLLQAETVLLRRLGVAGLAVAASRVDGAEELLAKFTPRAATLQDRTPEQSVRRLLERQTGAKQPAADHDDHAVLLDELRRSGKAAPAAATRPPPSLHEAVRKKVDLRASLRDVAASHGELALGCAMAQALRERHPILTAATSFNRWAKRPAAKPRRHSAKEAILPDELEDDDPAVVLNALRFLIKNNDLCFECAPESMALTEHESPEIRVLALHCSFLGEPPSPELARLLARCAKDPDARVRTKLAVSLGVYQEPRDHRLTQLRILLLDPDEKVRAAAVTSIGKFAESGATAGGEVAAITRDRSVSVRLSAIRSLRTLQIKTPPALGSLARAAAKDPVSAVAAEALRVLEDLGKAAAGQRTAILQAFDNPAPEVRHAAIRAAHATTTPEDRPFLLYLRGLQDPHARVRRAAGVGFLMGI